MSDCVCKGNEVGSCGWNDPEFDACCDPACVRCAWWRDQRAAIWAGGRVIFGCPHDSQTGAEGPVASLGRMPLLWVCDMCGALLDDKGNPAPRPPMPGEVPLFGGDAA